MGKRGARATVDVARRRVSMLADRGWARVPNRFAPTRAVASNRPTRFALVTVNFSTTRYLELMLLTLAEQVPLARLGPIVVVDNRSRDDEHGFLDALDARVDRVVLVRRRHRLHHGPAMRAGVRALDRFDAGDPSPAGVLLFCDTDVIFRDACALERLGAAMDDGAALAGEVRPRRAGPDIQASFFAVRRDVYARPDIAPLVHDGAPARRLQTSVWRAGLDVVDFPSNRGGYVLHRGRTGVAAAAAHLPRHAYATARATPHYMGVPDGAAIWRSVEERHARLLQTDAQGDLIDVVGSRFDAPADPTRG